MQPRCPYLGTSWDQTVPSTVPDDRSRCFARTRQVNQFLIFRKTIRGVPIPMSLQRAVCFAGFETCVFYQEAEIDAGYRSIDV